MVSAVCSNDTKNPSTLTDILLGLEDGVDYMVPGIRQKELYVLLKGMERNVDATFTNTDYLKFPTFSICFFNSIKITLWKYLSIFFSK